MPPPVDHSLLYNIYEKRIPFQTSHVLIGGDFSSILDATMDTSYLQRNTNPELVQWADTFALTELWRWKHVSIKVFSHLSAIHKSSLRIDLASGSPLVPTKLSEASYLLAGLSDHSTLELCLNIGGQKDPGTCRLAPCWVQNEKVAEIVSPLIDTYFSINVDTASPSVVWDAFKATPRGNYISPIKAARADYASTTKHLEVCEAEAAASFVGHPTHEAYLHLAQARREVILHYTTLTQMDTNLLAGKIFESEDKNGRLLANLVAKPPYQTVVSAAGNLISFPPAILMDFQIFFKICTVNHILSPMTVLLLNSTPCPYFPWHHTTWNL